MNLEQIAKEYGTGSLSRDETRELVQNLDLPAFDSDWDGKWLVSGDRANDPTRLLTLRAFGELTEEQFQEIRSFFPKNYRYKVSPTTFQKELSGQA